MDFVPMIIPEENKPQHQEEHPIRSDQIVKNEDLNIAQTSEPLVQPLNQSIEIVVPSYAAWFKFTKINDIEKNAIPEFFNNKNKSKTPYIYKDYRDFMINTYRLNPVEYLTVTACRRNLAGDVCAIIRVHSFLEQWGLINYQVDPDSRPSTIGPGFTGHFRVSADTPRGLTPFEPSIPVKTNDNIFTTDDKKNGLIIPSVTGISSSTPNSYSHTTALHKNFLETGQKRPSDSTDQEALKKVKFSCHTCTVDCSKLRYHLTKKPTFDICPICFNDGRFPANNCSADFVKITQDNKTSEWSDEDTLLLLEALEMYNEDWNKIADHVKNHSREECIIKFLKLPIEDHYLEKKDELGPLQYHRQFFSASDNPVLSLAAFLGSAVNPKVAMAAAKSAIDQLKSQENEEEKEQERIALEKKEVIIAENNANNTTKSGIFPADSPMEKAAATALGAAAAKSKYLSNIQEKECKNLVQSLLQIQFQQVELKLKQFETFESILEKEKNDLEFERSKLFCDRLNFRKCTSEFQQKQELFQQQLQNIENNNVFENNGNTNNNNYETNFVADRKKSTFKTFGLEEGGLGVMMSEVKGLNDGSSLGIAGNDTGRVNFPDKTGTMEYL
ncbi:hypothetical protein HK099_000845 [Clydaea vesicula]|uniref:SWIRM-domain-containing protein n=1 Tax=Clydaea vesicula TaxID=447962 RepID=A0AAD5U474_9FUNG|nr:hypothetical protein HK099_000845 [Clydaea vesicula]